MIRISHLRAAFFALFLLSVGLGATGCDKIKAKFTKKTPPPTDAPVAAVTPSPDGPSGEHEKTSSVPATNASTPARPSVAVINKSAAVMVLCYHRLEEKPRPKDQLAITPAEFEKEMQAIKDTGFAVIPMQDFLAWRRGDKDIPAKSAVITIDDGYVSGYDTAWPILKKFGYPFTMFVYINYINSGGKSISWDQLAEMRDAGVDIESHTYFHADLRSPGTGVDKHTRDLIQHDIQTLGADGWMRKEIMESKQILEKQLGIKVNCIAYPFGVYSPRVRELVKEAGYEAAFTVYGQRIGYSAPAYDILGRYAVEQTNPKIFLDALAMQGGGAGGPLPSTSNVAQVAAASMLTQPAQGETVTNPKPLIKANLATMGDIDPKSVEMRVSGLGQVPAKYDPATKTVTYQVTQNLRDKNYTVILSAMVAGKRAETRWDFNFDLSKSASAPAATPKPATKP